MARKKQKESIRQFESPVCSENKTEELQVEGVGIPEITPELKKALTQGSRKDRKMAALRWIASLPD